MVAALATTSGSSKRRRHQCGAKITEGEIEKVKKLKGLSDSRKAETVDSSYEYQIENVQDKFMNQLPDMCPLRYSFFRYIGFRVVSTADPKKAQTKGSRITLTLTLKNQSEANTAPFSISMNTYFKGGTYYFQAINMNAAGVHDLRVTGTYTGDRERIRPFCKRIAVYEVLDLDRCPQLTNGSYGRLMKFMEDRLKSNTEDEMREEDEMVRQVQSFFKSKPLSLGKSDLKWWVKMYFKRKDEDEALKYGLAQSFFKHGERQHKRKQQRPIRSGSEKEQQNYFDGRARERRSRCRGQIRIFTLEPLASGKTLVLYSTRELYKSLANFNRNH